MKDKVFIDTNILIYAVSQNSPKCDVARELITENVEQIMISSQVIGEFINACIKKNILSLEDTFNYAEKFMEILDFSVIKKREIKTAMYIERSYKYSYWDSLIVASALENDCLILYTEDMQHNQLIENKLRIINPLK